MKQTDRSYAAALLVCICVCVNARGFIYLLYVYVVCNVVVDPPECSQSKLVRIILDSMKINRVVAAAARIPPRSKDCTLNVTWVLLPIGNGELLQHYFIIQYVLLCLNCSAMPDLH